MENLTLDNDKPLVTFALFAYNQEQYIREAIEGAFAQTYEPLEIILSDDRSGDRTFAIMQEMATNYKGPHKVIVRQSVENRGSFNHVLEVAKESKGEIIVVGAGDDISLPQRTEKIINLFNDIKIIAVSSDEIVIDHESKIQEWDLQRFNQRDYWYFKDNAWLHGATAAYRKSFLGNISYSNMPIYYEDTTFSILIKARGGRTVRTKEQLIKYRHHFNNLSNRISNSASDDYSDRIFINRCKGFSDVINFCKEVIHSSPDLYPQADEILKNNHKSEYFRLMSNWPNLDVYEKGQAFIIGVRCNQLKTVLPRLFGKNVFFLLKKALKG